MWTKLTYNQVPDDVILLAADDVYNKPLPAAVRSLQQECSSAEKSAQVLHQSYSSRPRGSLQPNREDDSENGHSISGTLKQIRDKWNGTDDILCDSETYENCVESQRLMQSKTDVAVLNLAKELL